MHNKQTKIKSRDIAYVALFTAVMSICSWISIPAPVPLTLQTFGVFLSVGILGGKLGSLAVLVYLLLGAVGMPVFAGFSSGLGYMMGSTGGYIVGFLLSALIMWGFENFLGKKQWVTALSMAIGLIVCYIFGTTWFMFVYAKNTGEIGILTALSWCVFPYVLPDILKIFLAFIIQKKPAVYRHN